MSIALRNRVLLLALFALGAAAGVAAARFHAGGVVRISVEITSYFLIGWVVVLLVKRVNR